MDNAFLTATITGTHAVAIEMENNDFSKNPINLVENAFTLPNPQAKKEGNALKWDAVEGATVYKIYKNGAFLKTTTTKQLDITPPQYSEYKVSALDKNGNESFTSEPVVFVNKSAIKVYEFENYGEASTLPYSNYSGKGFVETSTTKNKTIDVKIAIETAGEYLLDVHYSNGSGPWNTDNKCAIRSLFTNNQYTGVVVMPQRGRDEWSDWGFSNSHKVYLNKGENTIKIAFEAWNNNMNVDVNTAMLDYLRVIKYGF